MSLAETQQIYEILLKIDQLLSGIEVKTVTINQDFPRTKETLATFRQLERLALRWLVLARRMGLPDTVGGAITKISQLIVTIRMMQMAINLINISSGNPILMAIGFAGFFGGVAAMSDFMLNVGE